MRAEDAYYTELDRELQNLAAIDWPTFVMLVGDDAIVSAKICMLLKRGKSLGQVASTLKETKRTVEWAKNNKCNCPDYSTKKKSAASGI